jgi:hypothetical protein
VRAQLREVVMVTVAKGWARGGCATQNVRRLFSTEDIVSSGTPRSEKKQKRQQKRQQQQKSDVL